MKFATIKYGGAVRAVLVDTAADVARPLDAMLGIPEVTILDLVRNWGRLRERIGATDGESLPLAGVEFEAVIPEPVRNIFCVGKNYFEHAHEFHNSEVFDDAARSRLDAVPKYPIVFSKVSGCVIGSGRPIRYPEGVSNKLDYEAELALIIGRGGRGIGRADALAHVWGYTIVNDLTARDLQKQHDQWHLGKSLDTFCPIGPFVVTSDALDPSALSISCWVNGELRQSANTRDLIFDIPTLIETISRGITLVPGDIIATGTPAGVGIGFDPPRYLVPGDEIEIEVSGIGRLSNRVAVAT
jgi:2-keto-4-pentenoate hydratase/2-oxohepta-3-ene-1,7-dioic acid hydratase in catechol pathway